MYGHERGTEDEQPDRHQCHAGGVQRRPQDTRRVLVLNKECMNQQDGTSATLHAHAHTHVQTHTWVPAESWKKRGSLQVRGHSLSAKTKDQEKTGVTVQPYYEVCQYFCVRKVLGKIFSKRTVV